MQGTILQVQRELNKKGLEMNRGGRPRLQMNAESVAPLRAKGRSWRAIAQETGVSVRTLRRACQGGFATVAKPIPPPSTIDPKQETRIGRLTVGGDKGFDTADFVRECRNMGMPPHVAQNLGRRGGSAIDSRTKRHTGYAISQKKRKRIEECFGWLKTIALLRKLCRWRIPKSA